MDDKKNLGIAKEVTLDFLTQMGLDAEIDVSILEADDDKPKYIMVKLTGDNLSELIGYHGNNLEAAQITLGQMVSNKTEDRVRLLLDINEYRDSREKYLKSYALRAANQVKESGQEMELPPMKPYERRIIHMTLKQEDGIETTSIGEKNDRRVVIKGTEELF